MIVQTRQSSNTGRLRSLESHRSATRVWQANGSHLGVDVVVEVEVEVAVPVVLVFPVFIVICFSCCRRRHILPNVSRQTVSS